MTRKLHILGLKKLELQPTLQMSLQLSNIACTGELLVDFNFLFQVVLRRLAWALSLPIGQVRTIARLSRQYSSNFNIQYVYYISLLYFLFSFCIFLFCFYIFYIPSYYMALSHKDWELPNPQI